MSKIETVEYDVIVKEDQYEIRKYRDFFIVEYENIRDPESQRGFGTLFKYIGSENKEDQKISMTKPVIEEMDDGGKRMAFIVPKKFASKIPEPKDENLKVKKFSEGLFAVIEYSGVSNKSKEAKMKQKLESWIVEQDYKQGSNYMLAFYNPPFTPPLFRRNEIWVRIVNDKVEED